MKSELVIHTLDPVFDNNSRVLVLGTMPSPKSREQHFYYANPRNRFWRVMEQLFSLKDQALSENKVRCEFLLAHHIALWDVLHACEIAGASDASIANPQPNDLVRIVSQAPIAHIFTTGTTAYHLYRKLCEQQVGMSATPLPSTSPANARMRLDDLVEAYRPIVDALQT